MLTEPPKDGMDYAAHFQTIAEKQAVLLGEYKLEIERLEAQRGIQKIHYERRIKSLVTQLAIEKRRKSSVWKLLKLWFIRK